MDAASESAAGPAPSVAVIVTPPGAIPVTFPKKLTRARVSWLLPQVTTVEKSRVGGEAGEGPADRRPRVELDHDAAREVEADAGTRRSAVDVGRGRDNVPWPLLVRVRAVTSLKVGDTDTSRAGCGPRRSRLPSTATEPSETSFGLTPLPRAEPPSSCQSGLTPASARPARARTARMRTRTRYTARGKTGLTIPQWSVEDV